MTIDRSEQNAAVIGHPIAHSRSPMIHNYWRKLHGVGGLYRRADVPPAEIARYLAQFGETGLVGANVTVPHKEAAYAASVDLDAAARAIGAVNTLVYTEGGLHGRNTDAHGFIANLDDRLPGWDAAIRPLMLLGAGGAARAVLHGLLTRGFDRIYVVNRTLDRAEALRRDFGAAIAPLRWDDLGGRLGDCGLLVNSTSLGMTGKPPLDIDLAPAGADLLVNDLVYAPLETPLLAAARRRGLRAADGLGMLLHQAAPAFAAWHGVMPAVTPELRAMVEADLYPVKA